jgi:hypothetical protein
LVRWSSRTARRTRLILRKDQIEAIAVVTTLQAKTSVDATDNPIGNGVNGRVIGGFVLALGPALLPVVEMDVATAVRVGRVHAQEGMAPADILDVHQEAVGWLLEEGRYFRQIGNRLRRGRLLTGGLATPAQGKNHQDKEPQRITG